MEISSTSNASSNRPVASSNNTSRDRAARNEQQDLITESRSQEQAQEQRAVQQKLQERRNEQRRLDGRLISYGHRKGDSANEYKQIAYNRSRVEEAYAPPKSDIAQTQRQQRDRSNDAIDVVV